MMLLLIALLPLELHSASCSSKKPPRQQKGIEYMLFDIGVSQLPREALSRHFLPVSEAPRINNCGQIIYNDLLGGCLWEADRGVQRLTWDGHCVHFHAINNHGAILGSYRSQEGFPSWLVWGEKCKRRISPAEIALPCPEEAKVYLREINDCGMISGLVKYVDDESSYGVVVTAEGRPFMLGEGVVWGLSPSGLALANNSADCANSPYLWHHKGGTLILPDTPNFKKPKNARYIDMLLAYDGVVYGTFCEAKSRELRGFRWDPSLERFWQFNIGGMRLDAMNSSATFVGSANGRAFIKKRGKPPVDLNLLIEVRGKCWKLLAATDINDCEQIVGYADVEGELHIFMLQRVQKTTDQATIPNRGTSRQ